MNEPTTPERIDAVIMDWERESGLQLVFARMQEGRIRDGKEARQKLLAHLAEALSSAEGAGEVRSR